MSRAIYLLSRISYAGGLRQGVVDVERLGIRLINVKIASLILINAFLLIYSPSKYCNGKGGPLACVGHSLVNYVNLIIWGAVSKKLGCP